MKLKSKNRTPSINLTVKRRYLTEREIERLMDCARKYGRYGHREREHDSGRLPPRPAGLRAREAHLTFRPGAKADRVASALVAAAGG